MSMRDTISVLLLVVACTNAAAEPTVLYDFGETISIDAIDSGLLDPIRTAVEQNRASLVPDAPIPDSVAEQSQLKADATLAFPLEVAGLSVARVEKTSANYPELTAPVCVIGADDKSLSWLVKYYDQLVRLNVKCLLVQVKDAQQLARVAQFARDIPVMPDVGGISKSLLKIRHYPVLISNNWIEQ